MDLPDPGIELGSPALQTDSLPAESPGKLMHCKDLVYFTWASLVAQLVRNLPVMQETWV